MLAADEAFLPDGRFVTLPAVPGSLLAEAWPLHASLPLTCHPVPDIA